MAVQASEPVEAVERTLRLDEAQEMVELLERLRRRLQCGRNDLMALLARLVRDGQV